MRLANRLRNLYRKRQYVKWMVHDERTNRLPISRTERLNAWRLGFLTFSYRMCEIDRHGAKDYVTDRMRYLHTSGLNNPYTVVLDDKLVFWEVFRRHAGLLPETYAILRRDRVLPLTADERIASLDDALALLRRRGRLVVKPTTGGGGAHIAMLEQRGDDVAWNGALVSTERLRSLLNTSRERLLMEFVEQAAYAREIHPPSTNTIRALSLWDDNRNEPFLAGAVHRFGSPQTAPVDNITQGGLDSRVDLATGRLGPGARLKPDGRPEYHDHHPDTGARIEGVTIPHWAETASKLLATAAEYPYLPYVGWDVLITEDGFRIIEGNSMSGLAMFQVHGPLLADPRVRRFFEKRGVLPKSA